MAPKLWTSPFSWNSLRPELVLAEKGMTDAIERVPADMIGLTHKTPEFQEKSVFGKVPLLEDDNEGLIMFESRAIARYFAMKYADKTPKLVPAATDVKTSGLWGMWLITEALEFDFHANVVVRETLIQPALKQAPDEAALARHRPKLTQCLDSLDKALSRMPFMGGEEYSLVDVFYMPTVHAVTKCVDVCQGRPHLQKWWETVGERPAWKKVVKDLDDAYAQVIPTWNK